jgi:hypothetical protein
VIAAQRWPANVCAGADFITGQWEIHPGERIVDCELDLDTKPMWGQVALHEDTVRNLNRALGWPTVEEYEMLAAQLATARADADLLRATLVEAQRDKAEAVQALELVTRVRAAKAPAST